MKRGLAALVSALFVAASMSVVSFAVLPTEAAATPCNHRTACTAKQVRIYVFDEVKGVGSVYNRQPTAAMKTVTFGTSATRGVTRQWEFGGEVSGGWGPVSAKVSAQYGKSYTESASVSKSESIRQKILPRHTAWMRVDFCRRVVEVKGWTERCNEARKACVRQIVAKATWNAPDFQTVLIQRRGHVFPRAGVLHHAQARR